jgi:hypothetical protein
MFHTYQAATERVYVLAKDQYRPVGTAVGDTTVFSLPTYTIQKVFEYFTVQVTDRFYETQTSYFTLHAAAVAFAVKALEVSTLENLNDHPFEVKILKSNPTG